MHFVAFLSLAALAVASPLNPLADEADKAVVDLQSTSPGDAEAIQMVSPDQVQDQGVGQVLDALAKTSPADAQAAQGLGRREDETM